MIRASITLKKTSLTLTFFVAGEAHIEAPRDSLVDEFLEFMEIERSASPRTLDNYRNALQRFAAWQAEGSGHAHDTDWRELRTELFRKYLFELMKGGMSRATVRLHFAALRSFYRYLGRRRGLENNPVADILLPKLEKKLPVVLTETQVMVRREDEQAFAELNGEQTKFVEDAARLLYEALDADPRIFDFQVACAHLESLHNHDAVAVINKGIDRGFSGHVDDFRNLVC